MIGVIAGLGIASTVLGAFQGYNQARQQQIQLEMQADEARYKAAVADLNRTAAANDIYNIGRKSDIERGIYGQQAAQMIAQTRLSAASRGVVGSTGSAAAQTAGADFAAQRDLYSMSLSTLQEIHNKRTEIVKYASEANTNRIMAEAYEDMADDINPWASAVASGLVAGLGQTASGAFDEFFGSSQLQNFSSNVKTTKNKATAKVASGLSSSIKTSKNSPSSGLLGSFFSSIGFR